MNRQRLDSPLVYVGAHNVYYVKLPVKVLYFTIHIHTQINQYVVMLDNCVVYSSQRFDGTISLTLLNMFGCAWVFQ